MIKKLLFVIAAAAAGATAVFAVAAITAFGIGYLYDEYMKLTSGLSPTMQMFGGMWIILFLALTFLIGVGALNRGEVV